MRKLRVDFYFPVLDRALANVHDRFDGKNKVILDGVVALQFDAKNSIATADQVSAAENFAALFSNIGINVTECKTQFKLAAQNKLLTDRYTKNTEGCMCFMNMN
jgi:hypothetical protein